LSLGFPFKPLLLSQAPESKLSLNRNRGLAGAKSVDVLIYPDIGMRHITITLSENKRRRNKVNNFYKEVISRKGTSGKVKGVFHRG
jgi:hypothetical protein